MLLDDRQRPEQRFQPASVNEFIGLRLALKLKDVKRLNFYLRACANFSVEQLRATLGTAETFKSAQEFADFFLRDSYH